MKRILIIEDDPIVANIYRNKFTNEGYQVETASDGEAGLQLAIQFQPDVIVLDLMLPKVTGTDLMKSIRAHEKLKDVPIIVFSNTYLTNMVQEAWKAGATKCLSKANCTPRQLIDVIRSVTGETGSSATAIAPSGYPRLVPAQTPKPASQPTAPPPAGESDADFLAGLRKTFFQSFPSALTAMRASHQGMVKADNDATRLNHATELYKLVHTLTGNAGVSGMPIIALMSDSLEALLKELAEKPQSINVSTFRTVASAIDFLAFLFERSSRSARQDVPSASILVVDDEDISRRAVVHAVQKTKFKCTDVEDPNKAFDLLALNRYDLVFLDVDMPGMNGFELCTKLRTLPAYKKTPVIFVTSLTDFESRASSMMSGGNDFIGKPFLFMELAVKAIVFVLKAKLAPPQ